MACSKGNPRILQRSIEQLSPLEVTERLEESQRETDKAKEREPSSGSRGHEELGIM